VIEKKPRMEKESKKVVVLYYKDIQCSSSLTNLVFNKPNYYEI